MAHSVKAPIATLDQIALLEHDWSTYGAEQIDAAVIGRVRALLERLPAACRIRGAAYILPFVVPTSDRGIQLEWHGVGGLELEFAPDQEYLIASLVADGEEKEWTPFVRDVPCIVASYLKDVYR